MENAALPPIPADCGLFSRTRWSLVQRAAGDAAGSHGALGELLAIYWYPF